MGFVAEERTRGQSVIFEQRTGCPLLMLRTALLRARPAASLTTSGPPGLNDPARKNQVRSLHKIPSAVHHYQGLGRHRPS
jgi:hypothetical protein